MIHLRLRAKEARNASNEWRQRYRNVNIHVDIEQLRSFTVSMPFFSFFFSFFLCRTCVCEYTCYVHVFARSIHNIRNKRKWLIILFIKYLPIGAKSFFLCVCVCVFVFASERRRRKLQHLSLLFCRKLQGKDGTGNKIARKIVSRLSGSLICSRKWSEKEWIRLAVRARFISCIDPVLFTPEDHVDRFESILLNTLLLFISKGR